MQQFFVVLAMISVCSAASVNRSRYLRPGPLYFTLSVLLSNPAIDRDSLMEFINRDRKASARDGPPLQRYERYRSRPLRLQINPVQVTGLGLPQIISQLFCSKKSWGTNALFLHVDDRTTAHQNSLQLANFMATIANSIGLPVMAWSSTASEIEQTINTRDPMLLLAPSVRYQAQAIFELLRSFLPFEKVCILVSSRVAGYDSFVNELWRLSDVTEEGRQHDSRFEFHGHQGSRFVQLVQKESWSIEVALSELLRIRDETPARAFVVYSSRQETERILEAAYILGMTSNGYSWISGRPAYDQNVPPIYPPGLIAITYDTSLNVQLLALKAAVRTWSEAVHRLMSMRWSSDQLEPKISCGRFASLRWGYGHLFHELLNERLERVVDPRVDQRYANLGAVNILVVRVNRQWEHLGNFSTRTGLRIADDKWRYRLQRERAFAEAKTTKLRVVTLDEPPFVTYELPPQPNGECPESAVPCRLSGDLSHTHIHAGEEHLKKLLHLKPKAMASQVTKF